MKYSNNNTVGEQVLQDKVIKDKTFVIKIKYNQNQSLQGTIQWLEKKKVIHFRSMMELMLLLNESVENKDIRTWKGDDGTLALINL